MGTRSPTFACSAIELTFLASLLGAETLVGIPDPFTGWLTEEVEAAWGQARAALADRGAIRLLPGGRVEVDHAVANLVYACATPVGSVMVTYTPADGQDECYYFHAKDGVVVQQERAGALHALTPCESPDHVWQRMTEILPLSDRPAFTAPPALLPGEDLARTRKLAAERGPEAAAVKLRLLDIHPTTAELLAQTLFRPVGNGAVVSLVPRQDEWTVDGIGVLEGENGLWLMRSTRQGDEEWVRLAPSGKAEAEAEIRRLLTATLAVPVGV